MKKRAGMFLVVQRLTILVLVSYVMRVNAQTPTEKLSNIINAIERYSPFERSTFPLGAYSESIEKSNAEFAQEQLSRLGVLDTTSLTETELISWELLHFTLKNEVDEFKYKMYLNPIQADQGFHLNLNYRITPILTYGDARRYLNMLNAIPTFVEEHLVLLKKGLDAGLSQPKIIFKGYEATYDTHIVEDYTESSFYGPIKELPAVLTTFQKDSVTKVAQKVIMEQVVPSFKKIKAFFETDYIPKTRTAIGVSETPNGQEFYQNRINYYTTSTTYNAEDIHTIGLSEVARIKSEMQKIIKITTNTNKGRFPIL